MNRKTHDAQYWLDRAEEARTLADHLVTFEARRELLSIAIKYVRLAEWSRGAMRVRTLIDGAAFGPEALRVIGRAFDEAWKGIAGNFGEDPQDIETARMNLANAVLSVASEESRDVEVLKLAALQRMALDYRHR